MCPRRLIDLSTLQLTFTLACVPALAGGCAKQQDAVVAPDPEVAVKRVLAGVGEVGPLDGAPDPLPALPAGPALSPVNTLVVSEADLAELRGKPGATPGLAPARDVRVTRVLERRSGSGATTAGAPLDQLAAVAYLAVARERSSRALDTGSTLSRNVVAIWDLAGRAWVGSLWVSVELTTTRREEMATVNAHGKQVGPSFTRSETPEQLTARHRDTLRAAIDEGVTTRRQVWKQFALKAPPFDGAVEKTYAVAVPTDRPARGAADARVVIQLFAQLGDPSVALLLARIVQTYGDAVRIIWRNRTLDFDRGTELAAQAALEVYAQAGAPAFWQFVDGVAAAGRTGDVDAVVDVAKRQGGVDLDKLRAAITTHARRAELEADLAAMRGAGLGQRTSATLVNGWLVPSTSWSVLDARIQAALK